MHESSWYKQALWMSCQITLETAYQGELLLVEEHLSDKQLPSLGLLQLRLEQFKDTPFDLSWLNKEHRFRLEFELAFDCSADFLLAFSRHLRSFLQPFDSLWLYKCLAICRQAQQVLSQLELQQLHLGIFRLYDLDMLPVAKFITITIKLTSIDIAAAEEAAQHGEALSVRARLPWSAVTSARVAFIARCEWLEGVDGCPTQLHVSGAPSSNAAWQQSLAEPGKPWLSAFSGWTSVTGLPAATSRAMDYSGNEYFGLRNQASLDAGT